MANNNHHTVPKNKISNLPPQVEIEQIQPNRVPLTALQREYLQQYAHSLNQTTVKVQASEQALQLAKDAEALAQTAANVFLRFCAESLDIDMRYWRFDQPNMQFVRLEEDNVGSMPVAPAPPDPDGMKEGNNV